MAIRLSSNIDMGNDKVSSVLWRLAIPSIITMVGHTIFHIVDTLFISWLGTVPLAAVSITMPVVIVEYALLGGCAVGVTALTGKALGMNKINRARVLSSAALSLMISLSLLSIVFLSANFRTWFFHHLGATTATLPLISDYLFWQIWSFPIAACSMLLDATYRSQGEALIPMYSLIIGNALNLALDPILIFSLGMGVAGASIATLIGRLFTLSFSWINLNRRSKIFPRITINRNTPLIWRRLLALGLPLSISQISFSVGAAVLNKLLSKYGEAAISGWMLGNRIEDLAFLIVFGFSSALIPFVAYNLGQRKYDRIRSGFIFSAKWASLLMTGVGIALFAVPGTFLAIFKPEVTTLAYASASIRASTTAYPLIALTVIVGAVFQGAGHTIYNLIVQLTRNMLMRIPMAIILDIYFGIKGIWWCQPLSAITGFAISLFLFNGLLKEWNVSIFSNKPKLAANDELGCQGK